MKLTHTLLLALATASLALSSCSTEPSDWRPDDKVSLDMVEPGTRVSENFAPTPPNTSIDNKGSQTEQAEQTEEAYSAESAMSANAEKGMRKRGKLNDAGKSGQQADDVRKAE